MIKRWHVFLVILILGCITPANAFVYNFNNGTITWRGITPYIMQGDTVCINQTIDISGVLQGNDYVVWYDEGKYGEEYSYYPYKIKLTYERTGWHYFYLDPAIFKQRSGVWYKFLEEKPDRIRGNHENMIAFIVNECDQK